MIPRKIKEFVMAWKSGAREMVKKLLARAKAGELTLTEWHRIAEFRGNKRNAGQYKHS